MLPLPEIQAMSEDLIRLYIAVEDDLLINVAKRFDVLDEVTSGTIADWQMKKLEQLGALRKENIKTIQRNSSKAWREIQKIITEGGYRAVDFDENIYRKAFSEGLLVNMPIPIRQSLLLQQALEGALNNTRNYFNLINTTALQSAQESFLGVVNQVYLETSFGITDYTTSIRKAVRQLADNGITGAEYISAAGRHTRNHIDVAVRRCIVTSTSQTAGTMQLQRAREWGSNLVEVTSHAGARPSHALWQGRIFSIEGGTSKYPNLAQSTGYGTVQGLKGANCGHDFYPFFEGIDVQRYFSYDLKENEKVYEQSQQQRKLEREIREQKRRILAADSSNDAKGKTNAQLKLREKESELKQFAKDTGRTRRTNRQQVMDFGHSEASKAVWAEKKAAERKDYISIVKPTLPKVAEANNTSLQAVLPFETLSKSKVLSGIVPAGAEIGNVRVIAGHGTSSEIRVANSLAEKYGGEDWKWQKKGGIIKTKYRDYDVHWYEYGGAQYETKLKGLKDIDG